MLFNYLTFDEPETMKLKVNAIKKAGVKCVGVDTGFRLIERSTNEIVPGLYGHGFRFKGNWFQIRKAKKIVDGFVNHG